MMSDERRALLITGIVGAGKTTTMEHVSARLCAAAVRHAVIDLDAIQLFWPKPPDDEFGFEVGLLNLADVARNYFEDGAARLVIAGVCETRRERDRYAKAIGAPLTVCRLHVDPDLLATRLRRRHEGDESVLRWHLVRAPQLDRILDQSSGIDATLRVTDQSPDEIADAVLRLVGWVNP